jgi:hypothetical protein
MPVGSEHGPRCDTALNHRELPRHQACRAYSPTVGGNFPFLVSEMWPFPSSKVSLTALLKFLVPLYFPLSTIITSIAVGSLSYLSSLHITSSSCEDNHSEGFVLLLACLSKTLSRFFYFILDRLPCERILE